jgi:ABC-type glycerol-3-phosphate transport system substrate-binding protein
MKSRIAAWSIILSLLLWLIPQGFVFADENDSLNRQANQIVEEHYNSVLNEWQKQGIGSSSNFEEAVLPLQFENLVQQNLLPASQSKGYGNRVFYWHNQQSISFEADVKEDGLYELSFDYYPVSNEVVPIEGAIQINGKYPFYESRRIVFPVDWKNIKDTYDKDRFGNDELPKQITVPKWSTVKAEDATQLQPSPLKYYLKKGKNTITLINQSGEMLLGKVTITSPAKLPNYKEYSQDHKDQKLVNSLLIKEAEKFDTKNNSYIRPVTTHDSSAVPNDPKKLLLNTFGGDSWSTSGQRVNWKVNVKKDGLYELTFKILQNNETGGPVFRKLFIDGKIPFSEVSPYTFDFNKKWANVTLSSKSGKPFLFYLSKGEHEIGLQADASPVGRVINKTNEVMKEIEDLSLSIKKLTGNQTDQERDWKITDFIPDIRSRVTSWANSLEIEKTYLSSLSKSNQDSRDLVSLKLAINQLRVLSKNPDEIPSRMNELSDGSSSVAQMLGDLLIDLQKQPLLMDRFYLHGNNKLPAPETGFWKNMVNSIERFFLSFTSGSFSASNTDGKTIEVWVNRPRQYVELIQNMADRTFTPKTGIKVKFSIMPDESKLILSSAAKKQPDVALGISNWLPYELSIRGAAVDLHQFKDFDSFSKQFSPGAFLPLMIGNSVYALPETQDFFVQFYRKDILNALNIPVPNTWDDVVNILPELQRYGMNYYTPIAGAGGFKPFQTTAPYIYQFNGDLYSKDGMHTAIDSEQSLKAIQFMTDLNTIYSLPLQVPNFYNHFRYGSLPIGISSFSTYVQLKSAAPEIAGSWAIAPSPGVKQKDGTVARWAPGSGQSAMIFKGTKDKEKSWELLKWWMSSETQTDFAFNLQTMYGPEYMWNTANLIAFNNLPLPDEDKKAIVEQWKYLMEVPKTPGSYMVERELSNIWNKIVFDGENTRSAVDDSVIAINREMSRKLEEFGYMKNGKVVKPYPIPTINQVKGWAGKENEK